MTKRLIAALLLTVTSFFPDIASSALTQDPALYWRTLTTEHFEIHFHDGEEELVQKVANISERAHKTLSKTLNWEPKSRTQVVVTDRFDFSNGTAYVIPRNWMQIIVTPPDSLSSLGDYNDWLELLIIHEYTHVLHLDKANGLPEKLRKIFGRFLILFPNLLQPPWVIEGLATYMETDDSQATGRGQNSYFRMLMRMEVENGIKPLGQVNQPLVSWPMNTSRYLYGVYFFNFIHDVYGEQKIHEFIENYSDNLAPFAINKNSTQVFGKPLDLLWEEFQQYLKKEFLPEIKKIKQTGVTHKKQITHSGYFTTSPSIAPNGDIYFIENNMQDESRLMVLRKGKGKAESVAITHGRQFSMHPRSGIVIAELDNFRTTNVFSDLYHIDPVSGKKTRLTHGKRYLHASWSTDGQHIIAVHNSLGKHALHLLSKKGELQKILWQGKDTTVLGPPDWSPTKNQLVFSVWRPGSQWNLELFDINTLQWKRLTNSLDIETTPSFTADGRNILFSADYGGVFNIQRLNLETGNITTLTNVLGGAFYPVDAMDISELFIISVNGTGFDLSKLDVSDLKTGAANLAQSASPNSRANLSNSNGAQKKYTVISEYDPIPLILPTGWIPYLYTNEERVDLGILTWGSDPIFRHSYAINLGYDAKNRWFVGRIDYLYDRWNPSIKVSLDKQAVTYLDNNNVIERYRNLDTYTVEAMWPVFTHDEQWLFHTGVIHEIESDKDIRSNFRRLPDQQNDLVGIALSYNSTERLPVSISPNFGRMVRAVAENSDILESYNSGQIFTIDWREFIDLPGLNVFSARGILGYGTDRTDYFRLGGTEETSVSPNPKTAAYAATQRIFGQRNYPLRGYPKGRADLSGRRMFLADLEWRFPILRLERGLMAPPIGIHQVHGKLFFNVGEAWNKESEAQPLKRGAGAEVTTELTLGYWIPVTVHAGFAKGFDEGGENQLYLNAQLSL